MIGRRDYETRRAARVARLKANAEKLRGESAARLESARKVADGIPFGQPILVGHHSEKRHRKDLARMEANTRKGFEALKEAQACERRAESAERNLTISSDDPTAIERLRDKAAKLEARRDTMKAINGKIRAAVRQAAKDGSDAAELLAKLVPCSLETARESLKPDFAGRVGFPAFELTNTGAEIRRLRGRIAELERAAAAPERAPETFGDVRIEESDNRVQVFFPGKPDAATRGALKCAGFRWAPSVGAWQRMANDGARRAAREIASRFGRAA